MEGIIVVLLVDNTSGAAGRSGTEKTFKLFKPGFVVLLLRFLLLLLL